MINPKPSVSSARVPRTEARRLLVGRGRFVDTVTLPRMLHAAIVRSSVAHATLLRLDASKARQLPGVVGVFSAQDVATLMAEVPQTRLETMPGHLSPPQPPLVADAIRYQGEPLAVVAAESLDAALDAVEAVEVELEEHPAIASLAAAAGSAGQTASVVEVVHGGPDGGSITRIEATFSFGRQTGVTLEPRGIVADYDDAEDKLTVWHAHQSPHLVHVLLARILGLPHHRVQVQAPDVGGGFGVKLHLYADEIATVLTARLLARPVKYVATRTESFMSDAHAREFEATASIDLTAQGEIAGMEADFTQAIGAYSIYPRGSVGDSVQAATQLGGSYQLPRLKTTARTVWQNKVPSGAIRGVGQPIACTVTEQLMDRAARHLGEDPAAFRRRHYLRADAFPLTTPGGLYIEHLSLTQCLDVLLEKMSYQSLRAEQRRLREQGILRGIGIATLIEQTAVGPALYGAAGVPATSVEETRIRLEADGSVRVETGATDQGQGTLTGIRQIVAQTIGVDFSQVQVTPSDSAGARGGGAWASRGLALAGEAALISAQALRDNVLNVAGTLLQTDADALRIEAGVIGGDGDQRLTLAQLARKAWYQPYDLPAGTSGLFSVTRSYMLEGRPHLMANGVQASLVEIDRDTGRVMPLKHWVVEDCGNILNPALVDGQVIGGVAQGIGAALAENCIYDECGQLLAASFLDYAVPRADGMPSFEVHHVTTPHAGTQLGVKGVGEAGVVGAPAAIWGAVNDALASLGACVHRQPITSEVVFKALAEATANSIAAGSAKNH